MNFCVWREGPKNKTLLDFMLSPPEGQLMRYQMIQHRTLLERWQHHVLGWLRLAEREPNVMLLRYEDLASDHATATRKVLEFAKQPADQIIMRPEGPEQTVYIPGKRDLFADERDHLMEIARQEVQNDELLQFIV